MSFSNNSINVFNEDLESTKGKDALRINITASRAIADAITTTFGPQGLNKAIIDQLGDVVVTSDGAKVLEEMSIENPTAKMIRELAKTIHKNVGDGAISAVLFVGALMESVEEMISMNLSPAIILSGFMKAKKELSKIINKNSLKLDSNNIKNIISLVFNTKNLGDSESQFSEYIFQIYNDLKDGKKYINLNNIQIIKKEGASLSDSKLINGVIIDKEILNAGMPQIIENAKIALVDHALEVVKTDFTSEINVSSPEDLKRYLDKEDSIVKDLIDNLKDAGANVVFCQKGIDESAQHYLVKNGIAAVRRVKNSDMKKLSRATKAKIITNISSISSEDLGNAGLVSGKKVGNDKMVFVENCTDSKSYTVLIRGSSEQFLDEGKRAIENGIKIINSLLKNPSFVGGAGSIEIELRKRLIDYAASIGGKEQISIEQFANALEIIPKKLIENSGNDPLDVLTKLRSLVDYKNKKYFGFDTLSGAYVDVVEKGFIESTEVKKQIFDLSAELVIIMVRIDNYLKTKS